ncbi:tyrosine-type recombinase/integrase [Streptomyces aurantiacus]|uniref:tyrosine-type recombinase/integrase n=1 Tax=Streptomyces aurantiacus TaxID=47760 RepID=UPI00286F8412|nr:tyrosine-type recombinase/integrase [Streptomyces aurantiacus]
MRAALHPPDPDDPLEHLRDGHRRQAPRTQSDARQVGALAEGAGGPAGGVAAGDRAAYAGRDQGALPHRGRGRPWLRAAAGRGLRLLTGGRRLPARDHPRAQTGPTAQRTLVLRAAQGREDAHRRHAGVGRGRAGSALLAVPGRRGRTAMGRARAGAGEADVPARPDDDVRQRTAGHDEVWKPALAAAGVIPMREKGQRWKASRKDGFHVLRHTFASVILEAGESVVTLARWLGHSSPTITLDHYAHFTPEAGGKGRAAVHALLGSIPAYVPESRVVA